MTEPRRGRSDWGPGGKIVTDGLQAGQERAIDDAAKAMLRGAPAATRFVLKKIPGAPGLVVDAVEFAHAKDKGRKIAGMAGSFGGRADRGGGRIGRR